ncbi:DUF58 domain-containing protein [Citricoccus sp. I39-566]|uniref:DUF58 domain-containing protein n=1 Tax=Citricoccus sp. I39-566 TaxID=3073268 RepID=UPI00286B29FE|nr:DUF58 domain-containing protein [Citricoccus sp. I39-566]WMY79717.1 DUF58 domain-containing protein [Citricoccus sp. I39-566]
MSTESSPRTRRSQRSQPSPGSPQSQPSRRRRGASAAGERASRTSAQLQDRWRRLRESTAVTTEPAREAATTWWGRRARPVLDVVSPLGWLVLSITAISWFVGLAFGWAEALIAGLVGVFLLLLAIGFILGRSSYRVELDLARSRVAVGDRAVGAIEVTNTADKALMPAAMELPVGRATAVFQLPRMRPAAVHEDLFTIPTNRRAVITVGPVRSVRQDPLSLLRRQLKWTEPEELFVHPRTVALQGSSAGFIRDLEGLPTRDLSSADVSFHALRDYVPGDDRRHIHWKTVARTNKLMVRQFEETRRAHLAIALSTNTSEYATENDFELAISVAASIGLEAFKEQRHLSIRTHAGPVHTETGRNMLDDMTRIEGRSLRKTSVDVSRETADHVPNASVFFLITGDQPSAGDLRQATNNVPPGVRAFAIRCAHGLETQRANIGDLTVISIGDLKDLGLALRKAAA